MIKDVNIAEFADKRKRTFESKKNWTFYTDSEDEDDEKNINNLHFVTLNAPKLSARERKEDVIKMKIEIWIECKQSLLEQGLVNAVKEESETEADDALTKTLIT